MRALSDIFIDYIILVVAMVSGNTKKHELQQSYSVPNRGVDREICKTRVSEKSLILIPRKVPK